MYTIGIMTARTKFSSKKPVIPKVKRTVRRAAQKQTGKVKIDKRIAQITPEMWLAIRKLLKTLTPSAISLKYDVPVSQIYARRRVWIKEDYIAGRGANSKYRTPQYIEWREACLKRDDYSCRHCPKSKRTHPRTTFQVDHIKSWATHPELRYTVSNGRTLCLACHRKTPTFGRKNLKYMKEGK